MKTSFSLSAIFAFLYKNCGIVLLLILILIALFSFKEYGISWDEIHQHDTGEVSYKYIFENDDTLLEWKDKDYGVAFELPLIIIEKSLGLQDSRDIYLMRHLLTHLFFLLGAYCLYLLIYFLYRKKWLALVGFLLLILHPRIYAHSFFNTKDIPFLSMFVICLYLTALSFKKQSLLLFCILGIGTGILINLRIMGILVPACAIPLLLLDMFLNKRYGFYIKSIFVYIVTGCLTLYATWPFLWPAPVDNFMLAYNNMANFRWPYELLFKGKLINAMELGWDYAPTWFLITNPIIITLLGLCGSFLLLISFLRKPVSFINESYLRASLTYLFYAFAPVCAVIYLHSVLYDGWRQLYFIYPSFILLAIFALNRIHTIYKPAFYTVISLLAFTLIFNTGFMIRYFPLQHVYFNNLYMFSADEYLRKHYEMDYWGTSYKESLEYILDNDSESKIFIHTENISGEYNVLILPPQQRQRIQFVKMEEADYFIANYRWHPDGYENLESKKWHAFTIQDNTVNQIFKLKK